MGINKVRLSALLWTAITVFVIAMLLLLDINRQRQMLRLESRVVYEFAYESALINEVILKSFIELVETDYRNTEAIGQYSREILEHYPHLRRLQIYQRIDPDQRSMHEQEMRGRGFTGYNIHRKVPSLSYSSFQRQAYPIVFVEPPEPPGRQLLGEDGYSIASNQTALIQSTYYSSAFATEPRPLADGSQGYLLLHSLDPLHTDTAETRFIVALVLSMGEMLPPAAHIPQGMAVALVDTEGAVLGARNNPELFGGWLLPVLEEQRSITRFGQTLQLSVKKQLLWGDTSWPFGVIIVLFSAVAYLISAQGFWRREGAAKDLLELTRWLEEERSQLEQRVLARTEELESRNAELHQQVKENRRLTQKILKVQESERRNIARELHDEMGQSLTAIRTDARLLQQYTKDDQGSPLHRSAVAIDSTAQRIYGVTYALMRSLRPSALDDLGLVDALHQCIESLQPESQGMTLHLELNGALNELPEQVCIQCFRIVQEALKHSIKSAQADNLWLSVQLDAGDAGGSDRLLIRIEDDGVGYSPKVQEGGFGLLGIRERVLALDGCFDVSSTPGQGAWIQVELPVSAFSAEDAADLY
ncbi:MAG: two-component system sensor histidine kinase UhpB [Motiliproteus sp.]|jgi:two-component system sensor histidine kinase UhpB